MNITLIVITLLSLTVAATMSMVSWRMVRDERLRSAARVAALAADIHQEAAVEDLPLRSNGREVMSASPLFASAGAAPDRSRFALVATIVLASGAVVAAAVVFGPLGSRRNVVEGRARVVKESPRAAAVAPAPLELVALGHERDADGLIVRGVLRNPTNGSEVDQLTAVVLLFNREGGFVASGRATVQATRLEPGGETTFVVTVPGVADAGRYRVSFRTDDGVVPHVDFRS